MNITESNSCQAQSEINFQNLKNSHDIIASALELFREHADWVVEEPDLGGIPGGEWTEGGVYRAGSGFTITDDGKYNRDGVQGDFIDLVAGVKGIDRTEAALVLIEHIAAEGDDDARDILDYWSAFHEYPAAPIVNRFTTEAGYLHVVVKCPFCSTPDHERHHTHGGIGARLSHCSDPVERRTYCVTDDPGAVWAPQLHDEKTDRVLRLLAGEAPDGFTLAQDGTLHIDEAIEVGSERWFELDRVQLEIEGWSPVNIETKHLRIREDIEAVGPFEKPVRYADDPDLVRIVSHAWHDIAEANTPPRLFLYGGKAARIVEVDGFDGIDLLDRFKLQIESARSSAWVTRQKQEERPARPPMSVVSSLLAWDQIPLPALARIVTAPVFSASGQLITRQGYHRESKLYYSPGSLKIKPIPPNPTTDDVERAKSIIETMLQDFPFVSDADRAHAWAAFFTIPCRDMIDGPTPITLFESADAGTGKGLLCESILHAFTDGNFERFAPAQDDAENRKRMTAALMNAKPALLIDNANDLSGASLASVTTANVWSDRYLGKSEIVNVPVRIQFVATGNNITLSGELARRVVRCRMEALTDRPWLRTGFKIENLPQWVRDRRTDIIEAVLTLAQSWIAAGMPPPKVKPLGSYTEWTRVVGGILEYIGITGFLGNVIEVYEKSDTEGAAIRSLIAEWFDKYSTLEVQSREVFAIAREIDGLPIVGKNEDSQARSFARFMAKLRQRIFSIEIDGEALSLQVVDAGKIRRAILWKLVPVGGVKPHGTLDFGQNDGGMGL